MKHHKTQRAGEGSPRNSFIRSMSPDCGFDALFDQLPGVSFFAKNKDGRIRLILLDAIGHASVRDEYDPQALLEVLGSGAAPPRAA